ncbi:MAG: hypothetical protein FJ137_17895 [Deltaproteobacteria bacterium]|nr:hypothetical protein [Deltaproteobacteria bacterium]
MESAILGALMVSSLLAVVVLAVLGVTRRSLRRSTISSPGRLRLPARAYERTVVLAVVAAASAVAPSLGADDSLWVGAGVVAAAVAWCAHRGVFLPLRADERTPEQP